MKNAIDIVHHAGLITTELDKVVAQYERMGFGFTPLSLVKISLRGDEPPRYTGLGNRCAIFEDNYLEVVGMPDPEVWASFPMEKRGAFNIDKRLSMYEGLHIMHFGTDDVEAVRNGYLAQRQPVSEVAHLQRMVDTPEGERLMRAKAISLPGEANPEALIQIAQHVTPEYVLQDRYKHHPNGARRLSEVIVCSENPVAIAAKYGAYTGHAPVVSGRHCIVDLGRSRVRVSDAAGLHEFLPGYSPPRPECLAGFTMATAQLAQTRRYLESQRIPFTVRDERLVVSPANGCGSAVVFEQIAD